MELGGPNPQMRQKIPLAGISQDAEHLLVRTTNQP